MEKKIIATNPKETYISYKSYNLIESLSKGIFPQNSPPHKKKIKKRLKYYKEEEYFNHPSWINSTLSVMLGRKKRLHPFTSIYTKTINKKIINTMLIYLLRNHGAHDLKLEYLDTRTFQEILKSLLFQMFIIIQELL